MLAIDGELFKAGMARIPAPVTVLTTYDATGRPRGFTASAVCSLSLEPPLVVVCLARSNASHETFVTARRFMVNLLASDQQDLAMRFAASRLDRFNPETDVQTEARLPALSGSLVRLACQVHSLFDGGDHEILVGLVEYVAMTDGYPLLYYHRAFARLDVLQLLESRPA